MTRAIWKITERLSSGYHQIVHRGAVPDSSRWSERPAQTTGKLEGADKHPARGAKRLFVGGTSRSRESVETGLWHPAGVRPFFLDTGGLRGLRPPATLLQPSGLPVGPPPDQAGGSPLLNRSIGVLLILLCTVSAAPTFGRQALEPRNNLQEPQLTPLQREIERQRQRLESSDVEERRDAFMRLRTLDRPEASRLAAKGLSDLVPIVRATAAHAVVHLPPEEAVALLTPLLRDRVEFVRQEVAYALGAIRARSAVEPLVNSLLSDKKDSVRGAAAVSLGQIGDESAVVALSQVLTRASGAINTGTGKKKKAAKRKGRENDLVSLAAAHSLGQIRSRAGVPALIAIVSDEATYPDARREAAKALGLIGDPSAVAALRPLLASTDPYLSGAAEDALKRLAASRK